jgi:hypothetical protein
MLYVLEGIALLLLLFALWLFIKIEPSMLSDRMLNEPLPKPVMIPAQNLLRETPPSIIPLGIAAGQVNAFERMSLSTPRDNMQIDAIQTEEEITLWVPRVHNQQPVI